MKKFIIMAVILGFVALPVVAAVQKATLINSTGKKVVVEVGSQAAQKYFGQGYKLFINKSVVKEDKPWYERALDVFGAPAKIAKDVIGSQTGTSTTGVAFAASSTAMYPIYVGNEADSAVITIKTTAVSGGVPCVAIQLLQSNDPYCDTASTTSSINIPVMSEINWYDAAYHLRGVAQTTTVNAATTTIGWFPTQVRQSRSIILEGLNARCLGLNVIASGTSLFAQIMTK